MRRLTAARALTLTTVNATAAEARAPLASVPDSFLGLSVDLNDIEGVAHPDFIGAAGSPRLSVAALFVAALPAQEPSLKSAAARGKGGPQSGQGCPLRPEQPWAAAAQLPPGARKPRRAAAAPPAVPPEGAAACGAAPGRPPKRTRTHAPAGLVRHLTAHSTGPMIFRVGANTADRLVGAWPEAAYKALSQLHAATGAQFILGVNQHAEDPAVTKQQVEEAARKLPAASVVGFAPGNEPGGWEGGGGGGPGARARGARAAFPWSGAGAGGGRDASMPDPQTPTAARVEPIRHVHTSSQERQGGIHHAQKARVARVSGAPARSSAARRGRRLRLTRELPKPRAAAPRLATPQQPRPRRPTPPPNPDRTSWIPTSQKIFAAAAAAAPRPKMLSGPDWSHVGLEVPKLEWWMGSVKGTLGQISVHHYGGDAFEDKSITDLLAEPRMVGPRTARGLGACIAAARAATTPRRASQRAGAGRRPVRPAPRALTRARPCSPAPPPARPADRQAVEPPQHRRRRAQARPARPRHRGGHALVRWRPGHLRHRGRRDLGPGRGARGGGRGGVGHPLPPGALRVC